MTTSSIRGRRAVHVDGRVLDVAASILVAAFLVLATSNISVQTSERALDGFGYALLVVAGVAVGASRHWPRTTLVVVTAVLVGYIVGRYPGGPIYLVGWIALFMLSRRTDRRTGIVGAAALCVALSITSLAVDGSAPLLHLVFVGWSAAAVFLGDALRNRRNYLLAEEHRARWLAQQQEEESRRRVAEERVKIARDLHDSVAHAIATINVQAGAAAHVIDRRPESAKPALDAIRDASREALDELAAMLRVLRADDQDAARRPTPGVAQVPELVAAAQAAHIPVDLDIDGAISVSPPIGTAVYRIVQESLTNVMRHAPGARTHVRLHRTDETVRVEVSDDGNGRPGDDAEPSGAGMGIRGMRERVETTGGSLDVGPTTRGGFRVVATWPTT